MLNLRVLTFALADTILSASALILAFLLRFDGTIPPEYHSRLPWYLVIFAGLNILFLLRERLYSFIWAFVGLKELTRLVRALTLAGITFALLIFIDRDTSNFFSGFPRSTIVLGYLIGLVLIGSLRIAKRISGEFKTRNQSSEGEPTLIVGAGRHSEQLIRSLERTQHFYKILGIVDTRHTRHGTTIHGIPVLGHMENIPSIIHHHGIKHIIIAFERDHVKYIREAVKLAKEAGITDIKIVPEFSLVVEQGLSFQNLKEISIEDLLSREATTLDTEEIKKFLHGKSVLVTGAAGSIGSELCRQIAQFLPGKLYLLDINESGLYDLEHELRRRLPNTEFVSILASVTRKEKIEHIFNTYKPEIVFHAAAYKHVPMMEEYPEEATETNIIGTFNTAQAAVKAGVASFVLISTDKAVNPLSVMGKTKRAAEIIVKTLNGEGKTRFVAVRFGNVLGSRGSVVPLFLEQIKRGGPVTVTHPDMVRYFMTIPEASLLVMEAGAIGKGGEIFILDMGRPVKIIELAKELIRLSGHRPDIDIPIVITGLRPGEKIFEDLLSEEERKIGATKWEKIFISKTERTTARISDITEHIRSLEAKIRAKNLDRPDIISTINKFITE